MGKKKEFIWLYLSIGSYLLMSASFLLMPIDFAAKGMQVIDLLIGIAFWLFLLIGIIAQVLLSRLRKKWFMENPIKRSQFKGNLGLIAFMQNLPACIADGAFAVSLIGLIISVISTSGRGYICYIFMAMIVFSFCMHCVLNGKGYYFIKNQKEILKESFMKPSEEKE